MIVEEVGRITFGRVYKVEGACTVKALAPIVSMNSRVEYIALQLLDGERAGDYFFCSASKFLRTFKPAVTEEPTPPAPEPAPAAPLPEKVWGFASQSTSL